MDIQKHIGVLVSIGVTVAGMLWSQAQSAATVGAKIADYEKRLTYIETVGPPAIKPTVEQHTHQLEELKIDVKQLVKETNEIKVDVKVIASWVEDQKARKP